jgi:hypothetical protein
MKYIKYLEDINFDDIVDEEYNELEHIKKGDKIIITDKLKSYIELNGWDKDMYNIIGKTFTVINPNHKYPGIDIDTIILRNTHFYIPIDCVNKVLNENINFDDIDEEEYEIGMYSKTKFNKIKKKIKDEIFNKF